MDIHAFDRFTRSLILASRTRRKTLALMASATAATLTNANRNAQAACKKVGKKCDKNKDCCDGAKCKKDKCTCKSGFAKCDKKCYDLAKDENHCGSCDTACAGTATCTDGRCDGGATYAFVREWGRQGSGNGEFQYASGLAVGISGDIAVTDAGNHRVQKFTSDGNYLGQWGGSGAVPGQFEAPRGIVVDAAGFVYVTDGGNNRIQKFEPA